MRLHRNVPPESRAAATVRVNVNETLGSGVYCRAELNSALDVCGLMDLQRPVDPGRGGRSRGDRRSPNEALWVGSEGAGEDEVASGQDLDSTTVVDI